MIDLNQFIDAAWEKFQRLKNKTFVVDNSIPILWFGDMNLYEKSKTRIVTVGLNPSKIEFVGKANQGTEVRFPKAKSLTNKVQLTESDKKVYAEAMNAYFDANPYKRWFNSYEKVLNRLDASYYKDSEKKNKAIHIDVYTSIATNPTWGRLDSAYKNCFAEDDEMFSKLLDALDPRIICISANKQIVENFFEKEGWNPYRMGKGVQYIKTKEVQNRIVIWGYNMRGMPFGGMKDDELNEKFRQIKEQYEL